jgi:cation:H+ antiporter
MAALAWFTVGLVLLVAGGELLVRAGTRVAAYWGVPPVVIGLTIVAVGTSTPELAVGVNAALQGNGAVAVGNIAGTNIVNILLILGLSALLRPLSFRLQTLRFDLPCMVAAALIFWEMGRDGFLTKAEGAVLIGLGLIFTVAIVYFGRHECRAVRAQFAKEFGEVPAADPGGREFLWHFTVLVAGIALIVVGADWLVDGAVDLARAMGVSDALIGLTIVAVGTSSPELVTAIIGTLKNERDIAIGNLIGSSVYNILIILGMTCLVPREGLPVAPELIRIDIPIMMLVAVLCIPVFISGRRVSRWEGGLFVAGYITYLCYLLVNRT